MTETEAQALADEFMGVERETNELIRKMMMARAGELSALIMSVDARARWEERLAVEKDGNVEASEAIRTAWAARCEQLEWTANDRLRLLEREKARAEAAESETRMAYNALDTVTASFEALQAERDGLREAVKDAIRILRNDPHDPDRLTESDELNHQAEVLLRKTLEGE